MTDTLVGRVWRVTVDEMIQIFRQALIDLIPTFERARITWRGDQTYDDFERIPEALWDSIVADSVANARGLEKAESLARYSFVDPGRAHSRILVNDPQQRLAFHLFGSRDKPFDTIECHKIGSDGRELEGEFEEAPYAGAHFVYEARFSDGAPTRQIRELEVNL
jgi:hypothetical protein